MTMRNIFNLTKAYREYHAPYGKTILISTVRYLSYAGLTISIKRFDTGYHTSRCHYLFSCGANHPTLREAIRCAKSRVDTGLTWNS
jgi:hypothetical protein